MARSYSTLVAEGRRLVAAEGDAKWALGDLALEVVPLTDPGAHTDALARFAEEIGIEPGTLSQYRRVAGHWPPRTRIRAASWSVHHALAPYEDAEKILKRLVREKRATVDAARAEVGVAPSNHPAPPTDVKGKAAQAKELLADPEVRRAVIRSEARTSARDLASDILKAGPAAADQVYHELRQQRAGVDTSPANRKAAEAKADEVGQAMIQFATFDLKCSGVAAVLDELNERVAEAISTGMVSERTLASIEEAAKRLYETAVAGKAFV
jgi:hypothetical protein